ncbi:hypothetical protein DNU06_15825 [Putridiphycobacter roseus]|uniref:Uncharacterized protein n=1 Tax=Putridiphycobacter roseus TaxID=2219161 RepID=A0A2W1NMJ0_9FLAO|nr:hypothetical protein DNU06_15825 [Putridiphycobacter roseus]
MQKMASKKTNYKAVLRKKKIHTDRSREKPLTIGFNFTMILTSSILKKTIPKFIFSSGTELK